MSEENTKVWTDTKMFGPLPSDALIVGFAIFGQEPGDQDPEIMITTNSKNEILALKMVLTIIEDILKAEAKAKEPGQ